MKTQGYLPVSLLILLTTVFAAQAQLPGRPRGISPDGIQATGIIQPTFRWNAAIGAEWYFLQVYEVFTPAHRELTAQKWVPAGSYSWTLDRKLMDGTYDWEVRAWNSEGFGGWSDTLAFDIRSLRPYIPGVAFPKVPVASGGSISYRWTSYDDRADWFEIWIERNGELWQSLWVRADDVRLSGTTMVWNFSSQGWGNYKSCIRGWNSHGLGRWSQLFEFPVGKLETVPWLKWKHVSTVSPSWYHIVVVGDGGAIVKNQWVTAAALTNTLDGYKTWDTYFSPGMYNAWIQPWSSQRGLGPWSDPTSFTRFIFL